MTVDAVLADAAAPRPEPMSSPLLDTDVAIIGGGPAGLFAVFELGLLEIGAHVVDALPHPGGQCVELYGDKPLYDIPGLPLTTGRELVDNLLRQASPFNAPLHLAQTVSQLTRDADGRFLLGTTAGTALRARAVLITAGVGAFAPKRLCVDGLEAYEGRQLFHHSAPAWHALAGHSTPHLVIVGGEDTALEAALRASEAAAPTAGRVTLVHRTDRFQADERTIARVQQRLREGSLHFLAGQVTAFDAQGADLQAVHVSDHEARVHTLPVTTLLVLQGLSPKLGPIADWGLAMAQRRLSVDTGTFATSEAGIFAAGDICTYPGKLRLILSAFHEATLAAYGIAAHLRPGQRVPLEYTTSSTRLHRLLGVASEAPPPA